MGFNPKDPVFGQMPSSCPRLRLGSRERIQIGSIEMKQVAVKQLDLLRHVASGFSDQIDLLQQISDDIGANLNKEFCETE